MVIKSSNFWDKTLCNMLRANPCFEGKYRLRFKIED
jgi:hypothetical protein